MKFYNSKIQNGFTLIELMVVISIMAIFGAVSIAGFSNFNQAQVLQTSANDVATMLNLAKSRAQSQVKPSELCPTDTDTLSGYSVVISNSSYTLYPKCLVGGNIDSKKQSKILPTSLSFVSNTSFFFPVQTGGATQGVIGIINTSSGAQKNITVTSLGGVSISP